MSARPWNEKPFRDALRMELAAAGEDLKALRTIAAALIERAQKGDTVAAGIVIDRVDGKVPQAIAGDPDQPLTIRHIAWLGDQTIHDVKNPRDITNDVTDVTNNGHSQAQITGPRSGSVTIALPGDRKRAWAREHMRKMRAKAKAARASHVLPTIDDDSEKP